jgi:MFS family permease
VVREYRDAARRFSRPGRHYLLAVFLAWFGNGIFQVLFNLYLQELGHGEAFIGRAISMSGFGLAIAALPAGRLADHHGRLGALTWGAGIEAVTLFARALLPDPGLILAASFLTGVGQALLVIAGAPFLTEHSTARERTHLFSAFFAVALLAGVAGSAAGGLLPWLLGSLPAGARPSILAAFRATLALGGLAALAALLPLLRLRGLREQDLRAAGAAIGPGDARKLWPIALNSLLIGAGAGLVIPFMNLYFRNRFECSSAQIGLCFAVAQVFTAFAALAGPPLARRWGKLRTAVASQLLSLPFLVTLGAERHLPLAVGAFWMRAVLMQASTPLIQNFVMEVLPPALRARSTSLNNLLWNAGWALSAAGSGLLIQTFGYALPFYVTAGLYAVAAAVIFVPFRHQTEPPARPAPPPGTASPPGEGPLAG